MAFIRFIPVLLALFSGLIILFKVKTIEKTKGKSPDNLDDISVIIPAYNEAERIKPLLYSLRSQNIKPGEIIVCDDHSTDKTGEIAKAFGYKVIKSMETDDTWIGKSRALWTGANEAKGRYLLFLDADTRLSSDNSLLYIFREYIKRGDRGILSIQPYHKSKKLYESLSLMFNIIVLSGMGIFTPLGERVKPIGAFGPCVLTKKQDYISSGGHKEIKGKVLDDIALGKLFMEKGHPSYCYGGRGIIDFRMYPEGIKSLLEGWSKNFGEGAASCSIPVLLAVIIWVTGGFSIAGTLTGSLISRDFDLFLFSFMVYLLYMFQMYHMAKKAGRFSIFSFPLFFIHHIFFTLVFLISLVRRKIIKNVSWRGRKIKV